jgi:hypothetical protein
VDNTECNKFDDKINKLIKIVSERLPIPDTERLAKNTKKRKWLILAVDEQAFRANKFEEFFVKHNYVKAEGNDQVSFSFQIFHIHKIIRFVFVHVDKMTTQHIH